jgi:uncharacterized protein
MNPLKRHLSVSPIHARFLPFLLFVLPLFVQDSMGEEMRYWIYLARTLIGAWCVWEMRSLVPEMRWKISWEGAVVGVLMVVVWVGLNPYYPPNTLIMKQTPPWTPFKEFEAVPALGWFFFLVRTLGTTFVVPQLEEVFWRSFLYRYLVKIRFEELPLGTLHWLSLIVTSTLFGLQHFQWLAGILCGLSFQFLVIRKKRLGDAIFAHAVTNFLLSLWVFWKGDWQFW